jgi:integrase
MTQDIHKYEKRLESTFENLQNSDEIREENKELADRFNDWLAMRDISFSRQYRYIISLKKILEHNEFRFDDLGEDEESKSKITKVIGQIQNSEYYHKEYSAETKKEYKSVLKRLLEFHEIPSDPDQTTLLPTGFTAYVPEKDRNHTDPQDLPTPKDVAKIARKMEAHSSGASKLRDPAMLLTLWDTGSRIGECLSIKLRYLEVKKESVKVKVPGNKESPDRNVPCAIAGPAIKEWLENGHPDPENEDALLFCNLQKGKPEKPASYRYYTQKLKKAYEKSDVNCRLEGEVNHIFRKGRMTYLNKAGIMDEAMIDKRVGHIEGSDETRTYTRISDEEAENDYYSGYGLEDEADQEVEKDLLPIECLQCKAVNSGHRKSCKRCGDILEDNYLDGVEVESSVDKEIQEMTNKLNKRIIRKETALSDEEINEEAKKLVAKEKGLDPEQLQW